MTNDLFNLVKLAKTKTQLEINFITDGVLPTENQQKKFSNYPNLEQLLLSSDTNTRLEITNILKRLDNDYRRYKRLKERITNIFLDAISRKCVVYFLTMTFSPDYVNKTTFETRRVQVRRFLKKFGIHFVGNIDFGEDEKRTHREHYHAVASSIYKFEPIFKYWFNLTNSYCKVKIVPFDSDLDKAYTKLSKYVSKLTNHAKKESVKLKRYIFDRNKSYMIDSY